MNDDKDSDNDELWSQYVRRAMSYSERPADSSSSSESLLITPPDVDDGDTGASDAGDLTRMSSESHTAGVKQESHRVASELPLATQSADRGKSNPNHFGLCVNDLTGKTVSKQTDELIGSPRMECPPRLATSSATRLEERTADCGEAHFLAAVESLADHKETHGMIEAEGRQTSRSAVDPSPTVSHMNRTSDLPVIDPEATSRLLLSTGPLLLPVPPLATRGRSKSDPLTYARLDANGIRANAICARPRSVSPRFAGESIRRGNLEDESACRADPPKVAAVLDAAATDTLTDKSPVMYADTNVRLEDRPALGEMNLGEPPQPDEHIPSPRLEDHLDSDTWRTHADWSGYHPVNYPFAHQRLRLDDIDYLAPERRNDLGAFLDETQQLAYDLYHHTVDSMACGTTDILNRLSWLRAAAKGEPKFSYSRYIPLSERRAAYTEQAKQHGSAYTSAKAARKPDM